jgi:hypothetical protein
VNHTLKTAGAKLHFLSVGFFSSAGGALLPVRSWEVTAGEGGAPMR